MPNSIKGGADLAAHFPLVKASPRIMANGVSKGIAVTFNRCAIAVERKRATGVRRERKYFCKRGWTGKSVICPSGGRAQPRQGNQRMPTSHRADFKYLAVVAGLKGNAKLTAAVELCHYRHHGDDGLAPAIVKRCLHACF